MKHLLTYYLITLITLTNVTSGIAQNIKKIELESDEGIIWTNDRKLKKTDFLGQAKAEASGKALTGANIIIVPYAFKNGKYKYRVLAKFYKQLSWINTDSNEIINHEQLHFDIAELFARKMRKEIELVKRKSETVLESDYRRIHKLLFQDYINYQRLYDAETRHSTIEEAQEKWDVLIAEKLELLKDYKLNL